MKAFIPPLIFLLFILAASTFCAALNPALKVTQYKIDSWNIENGLPQNAVYAILQTPDGYLWLGTEEGLIRFDGVTFTSFDDSNTPAFRANFIYCLASGGNGRLWIGTRGGGVALLENGYFRGFPHPALKECSVMDLLEDSDGSLWIGAQQGLLHLRNESIRVYTHQDGLAGDWVRHIRKDNQGRLWLSTRSGISIFKNGVFTNRQIEPGGGDIPVNRIRMTFQDSRGLIWIGSYNGLFNMKGDAMIPSPVSGLLPDPRVLFISEDSQQNLWIGTPSGLVRLRDGRVDILTRGGGLSDDYILSLFQDREGGLWAGSAYGGLNRLINPKFTTFSSRDGLPGDVVFAVHEDPRGALWCGTNKGIGCIKSGKILRLDSSGGLSHDVVNALAAAPGGAVWVGAENGLCRVLDEGNSLRVVERFDNHYVVSIHVDRQGDLWLGTNAGLFKKSKSARELTLVPEFQNSHINVIFEDREGNIWLTTYPNGLIRLKGSRSFLFSEQNGLISNSINCLCQDRNGAVWVGAGKGLSRISGDKVSSFTKKNGLYDNNIYKIMEDNAGYFWMSCNKGIFRAERKALEALAGGAEGRIECQVFGKDDGMLSNECNGGFQSAGCSGQDGSLWFPTMKGVAGIHPDRIPVNTVVPPVIIEAVDLDGVKRLFPGNFEIQPETRRVDFTFTALSLQAPGAMRFKYRLEGFADEWVDLGARRNVSFTNLDPGDYRFSITACNNDGVWNRDGASLSFTVIPPLWRKMWFLGLAVLIFAIISYFSIHFIRHMFHIIAFWRKSQFVGKYRILEKLGAGGMGTVYKARNLLDSHEIVALKVLKEELFADESNRKRFRQEAAIIDQLDHPNIIRVFERGQAREKMYIAMELLEGKTLTQKIKAESLMETDEALHIMIQVSDAMSRVHSRGIIHRDLKPDNIMLICRDQDPLFVKLLDFGLARMEYQSRLTQSGMVIGTLNYMAPEQISGSEYSTATDVYSLGVIFYEMLTGIKPFSGESTLGVMRQIMNDTPVEPMELRFDAPSELSDLLMAMIEKDGDERPDIDEVSGILKHIRERLAD